MKRNYVALAICLLSTAIVGVLFYHEKMEAWKSVLFLASVWTATADWLGQRFWLLNLSLRGVHREAKRGSLRLTGLAAAIHHGAMVLFLATIVCFFETYQPVWPSLLWRQPPFFNRIRMIIGG